MKKKSMPKVIKKEEKASAFSSSKSAIKKEKKAASYSKKKKGC